jgi:phage tail sheath protein FI
MPVSNYATPGVYVEEIPTLPSSIVQVSTAIPAFLGYTEFASNNGVPLINVPTRISSMLDYMQFFGRQSAVYFDVDVSGPGGEAKPEIKLKASADQLYYALDLFFKNGGSVCYIVSLGAYPASLKKIADFEAGLKALEKEEEPTLIVLAEACSLVADEYYGLCQTALLQCTKFKNRFCILDVKKGAAGQDSIQLFRGDKLGNNNLKYGAAYYPYLKTSLNYTVDDTKVDVIIKKSPTAGKDDKDNTTEKVKLETFKATRTAFYNAIMLELSGPKYRVELPPSPAIAAVYAVVDSERGVWKAPANVSLNAVIGPVEKITADEQAKLNIDATSGKSINAIRSFVGKGTVVWGARTLAGNDNEWRYISVRRLFSMIEDSATKATFFAVFEPNEAGTWLKVKSMIESFLYGLWQQGALAGSTAKSSYFVNVGLGSTMTTQDILEGRMIVDIGLAAVRPADFIILKFSHQLQEA